MEPIDLNLNLNYRYVPQMLLLLLVSSRVQCQVFMNRAPQFIPGQDMTRFSLSENTPVNSPVYQLRGEWDHVQVYETGFLLWGVQIFSFCVFIMIRTMTHVGIDGWCYKLFLIVIFIWIELIMNFGLGNWRFVYVVRPVVRWEF